MAINTNLHFSNDRDDWATPQELFNALDSEFGFTLDVCASPINAKCSRFFTKEQNGLAMNWAGERVFCNPPYGKEIGKWVKKSIAAVKEDGCEIVVMLIPARTDTQWFHEYIYNKSEIRFLKGRIKFEGAVNNAPFPSMVVIFRKEETDG